jgi:hypothetical protein
MHHTLKYHFAACILIVILTAGAYSNTFTSDWHFDDFSNIVSNYSVHAKTVPDIFKARYLDGTFTRYLGFITFSFNYYFHGMRTGGYHLGNLLIHISSAVLVYCIVYLTLSLPRFRKIPEKRVWLISCAVALLWSLNPVQTEAVTYIVQRFTSLAALLALFSFMLYIKGRRCVLGGRNRPGYIFIISAFPVFLASVLVKENIIVMPLVVLVYEHLFIHKIISFSNRKMAVIILLSLLSLLFLIMIRPNTMDVIVRIGERYKTREFTLTERILTQFRVLVRYISLILFPHPSRLNLDYNYPISTGLFSPVTTFFSMLFIAASLVYGFIVRNRDPLIAFCIFWFYINNAVESTFVPLEIIFEHRMYLPSLGVILLAVILLMRIIDRNTGLPEDRA